MFEMGFSELLMVALVGLLVIGPERLPKVARITGFWLGKARNMAAAVKAEIAQELHEEEFRQAFRDQVSLDELENIIENATDSVKTTQSSIEQSTEHSIALVDSNEP